MDRKLIIENILSDLEKLRDSRTFENRYALGGNIEFFNAIKSFPSYFKWLLTRAPYLEKENLLELQDLPFPRWDREMHARLIEMERKDPPGLIKPLVDKIVRFIVDEHRALVIANFGYGGMEVERQVISELLRRKHTIPVIFVGIDKSLVVADIAKDNLRELGDTIHIREVAELDHSRLQTIVSEIDRHTVILCKNNIFSLTQNFLPKEFNLIFHSLFMHHLNNREKGKVRNIIRVLAKNIFEYDGYRSWFVMILQTIVGWNYPPFLNAEIFSNLRFDSRAEIRSRAMGGRISFGKAGTYLMEYKP